ncbi:MAG: hypothetical protein LBK94_08005 [Prevotellaceae bacterium]|jgi:hypothetical protein|nr:hypothetical protein [Prevotellaceae bacterium]
MTVTHTYQLSGSNIQVECITRRKIGIYDFSTMPVNYYNSQFKRAKQAFSYPKKLDNCRRRKTARWIPETFDRELKMLEE